MSLQDAILLLTYSLGQGVRSPATPHPHFCGCCWCLTQIAFAGWYTPGPPAVHVAANGSQMPPCQSIALGHGSLPSCIFQAQSKPLFFSVFLNWVQRVGIKNGSKRRKPRSLSLPSSRTKEEMERGGRKKGKAPRKKKVGDIVLKAASHIRKDGGWKLDKPPSTGDKVILKTAPHPLFGLCHPFPIPCSVPLSFSFLHPDFLDPLTYSPHLLTVPHCWVPGSSSVFIP